MKLWSRFFTRKKEQAEKAMEEEQLLLDLEKAKEEWDAARIRLDQVVEKEEIDYAIYAYEAAQKRYELLLRHVRKAKNFSPPEMSEDKDDADTASPNNALSSGIDSKLESQLEKEEAHEAQSNEHPMENKADESDHHKEQQEQQKDSKEQTSSLTEHLYAQKAKLKINPSRFHLVFDLNNKGHMKGEG